MPTHMSAQTGAMERNTQAELLVDLALRVAAERWHSDGHTESLCIPEHQKDFARDDCSDVFDHYLEARLTSVSPRGSGPIQVWGQTTCYKGNMSGRPEPNKTYEIRETLVESLYLQKWLELEAVQHATFHVTFGPSTYSYGWIKDAKEATFDLSLYPVGGTTTFTVYDELAEIFSETGTLHRACQSLRLLLGTSGSALAIFFSTLCDDIYKWGVRGFPSNPLAREQAALGQSITQSSGALCVHALRESSNGGGRNQAGGSETTTGGHII